MNKAWILVTLPYIALFAQDSSNNSSSDSMNLDENAMTAEFNWLGLINRKDKQEDSEAIHIPEDLQTKSWNLRTEGSFLYYYTSQDGMFPAYQYQNGNARNGSINLTDGKLQDLNFDWDPGFQVGLAFSFGSENPFEFFLEYFRLNSDASRDLSAPNGGSLIANWVQWELYSTGYPTPSSLSAIWSSHNSWLNFELAKYLKLYEDTTFRPFFGMEAAWIDQRYDQTTIDTFESGINVQDHLTSDMWGLGMRVGMDSRWAFAKDWEFCFDISGSILFSSFEVQKEEIQLPSSERMSYKVKVNTTTPHLEMGAGFAWDHNFYDEWLNLRLYAGYDFKALFSQNYMRTISDDGTSGIGGAQGDLYMQGLNVGAGITF